MSVAALPNLGPASAKMLAAAGIENEDQLRQLGPVLAYWRTIQATKKPHLNLLWAIAGALTNTHWTQIDPDHRTSLLLELDALQDVDF